MTAKRFSDRCSGERRRVPARARNGRRALDRELFAEILRLPGIKVWLVSRFNPDVHGELTDSERQYLTRMFEKIKAAYDALEQKDGHRQ
jgi:hypothetical protein